MDARTRRLVGWALVIVGVAAAIIGGLADQIGLGGEGEDEFGGKQVAALVAAVALIAVGLVIALWRSGPREPSTTATPGQPTP